MAISWTLNDGVLTISGSGAMDNYTTSNRAPWYESRSSITSIIIENGVTSIGDYAFYNCTKLTNITISDSVTSIGNSAFYNCTGLKNTTIPNSVTSIGNDTFASCRSLTSMTIPSSVTSIGGSIFLNCINLTMINVDANNTSYCSVGGVLFNKTKTNLIQYPNGNPRTDYTIPDSVTNIGNFAFSHCDKLTNVTIPDSVQIIGYQSFIPCTNLIAIDVDANNPSYSSADGVLFNKTKTNLIQYPNGNLRTDYTIPDSVISINYSAFQYCTTLTNVTIPDSVTSIGDSAFYGCTALTDIYYTGNETDWNAITIGNNNEPLLNATKRYGSSSINPTYLVTKAELTSMANAIRTKTGTTSKYTWPNQMINAIREIPQLDTTDATATAADILDGKTAYVNGEKITGTHVLDGYQILNGTITAEEPTMNLFFEDLSFEPEGAVIYHKAGQNATYAVNGNYLLLFGYGTTENSHNIALSWKSNANKQSALYVDWYEEVLSLTTDGRFNGPYNYMIWGK